MAKRKLIITGLAGHGKDTVCEILRDRFGYSFESSSRILLKEVIFPVLKEKYGYKSEEECYLDRVNHRAEWFELLKSYNTPDKTALGTLIFEKYDIYCGLRNREELAALREKYPDLLVFWVSADKRIGLSEFESSITITEKDCTATIENNGSVEDLVNCLTWASGYPLYLWN